MWLQGQKMRSPHSMLLWSTGKARCSLLLLLVFSLGRQDVFCKSSQSFLHRSTGEVFPQENLSTGSVGSAFRFPTQHVSQPTVSATREISQPTVSATREISQPTVSTPVSATREISQPTVSATREISQPTVSATREISQPIPVSAKHHMTGGSTDQGKSLQWRDTVTRYNNGSDNGQTSFPQNENTVLTKTMDRPQNNSVSPSPTSVLQTRLLDTLPTAASTGSTERTTTPQRSLTSSEIRHCLQHGSTLNMTVHKASSLHFQSSEREGRPQGEQVCAVQFSAHYSLKLYLLVLDQTCRYDNTIFATDGYQKHKWTGCQCSFSPGPEFLSSFNKLTVHIVVANLDRPYMFHVQVKAIPKPSTKTVDHRSILPSLGYFQTPGWDPMQGKKWIPPINFAFQISLPSSKSLLLSVVHSHLPRLMTYPGSGVVLQGAFLSISTSLSVSDRLLFLTKGVHVEPMVIPAKRIVIHFRNTRNPFEYYGFRILYTTHKKMQIPKRGPGGLWNCSVPNWPDFRYHFRCNMKTECIMGEDEQGCPLTPCLVGNLTGLQARGRCYVHVRSDRDLSWFDARDRCLGLGAQLASLTIPEEWALVSHMLLRDTVVDEATFVGLSTIHAYEVWSMPLMYRYFHRWEDNTMAYYQNFQFNKFDEKYCSEFDHSSKTMVYMVPCAIAFSNMYLCETGIPSGDRISQGHLADQTGPHMTEHSTSPDHKNDNQLSSESTTPGTSARTRHSDSTTLPLLENVTTQGLVRCPQGHVTDTYLACDHRSSCWTSGNIDTDMWGVPSPVSCGAELSRLPPLFVCSDDSDQVSFTLVCDRHPDCPDVSDESFCQFQACSASHQFECTNRQCIAVTSLCDGVEDCRDRSDEMCHEPSSIFKLVKVVVRTPPPPALVRFDGRGHVQMTTLRAEPSSGSVQCGESHFQCPGGGYCLPVYVRCNLVNDCPGWEDEADCDLYQCPGFYRCRGSTVCLHVSHLCDGWPQCPQHSDEILCNLTCPQSCTCHGLAFTCTRSFHAGGFKQLRYVEAAGTGMSVLDFEDNLMLIHLGLGSCGITRLRVIRLPNLRVLNLRNNSIGVLRSEDLQNVSQLRVLSVAENPIDVLFLRQTNLSSLRLQQLDLSAVSLRSLNLDNLSLFSNLRKLNLSRNVLDAVTRSDVTSLTTLKDLDLGGSPVSVFSRRLFWNLTHLEHVRTDNYQLCCPAMLPSSPTSITCTAPFNHVSSCDALLQSDVYRVALVLLCTLALTGNLLSFVFRALSLQQSSTSGFLSFVLHLCVADFLMGVYLVMVGVADRLYLKVYLWKDRQWRLSAACQAAGFLSLLSNEVSALLICLITLDRFLVIRFPFSRLRFQAGSAHLACVLVWLLGLLLACVPLLPLADHWRLYSQTGICIPLPLSSARSPGHNYVFGVMIVLNFILFLATAAGQASIYVAVRANRFCSSDATRKAQDISIARRLIAVAMSDFLCWFPIGLLGLLASRGLALPGELNVGVAMMVVPLNSAVNPFLYTVNTLLERRRRTREEQLIRAILSSRQDLQDKN